MRQDDERYARDLLKRAMEKKSIIWERTDGGPWTIQEYESLLNELIEKDNPSETDRRIDVC